MSNMEYCRFYNTALDLEDCLEALDQCEWNLETLSPEEKASAIRLLKLCTRIAADGEQLLEKVK